MKIKECNFSKKQFLAIYEFLSMVNETNNNLSSNYKIDGLQYFKDKNDIFYASYCLSGYGNLGFDTALKYIEIDKEGQNIDLTKIYDNISDIARRFERYEEITL
jgi:hypothetical protein